MSIKTILSSAVIAAVFSGIVSYLISKRQGNLQYRTAERKEWREKIREIARQLDGASYKKTLRLFTELKVRINSFGNNGILKTYASDAHIWKVINELEEKKPSDKVLHQKQKQLIEYLSLLLKMDWERSKKEVRGNIYGVISGTSYVLTVLYFAICIFYCNRNDNYENMDLVSMVGTMVVLVIGLHIILIRDNKSKCNAMLMGDIALEPEQYDRTCLGKCYLTYLRRGIVLCFLFSFYVFGIFMGIHYVEEGVISQILLAVLYLFGLGFQTAAQNIYMENQYNYVCAINKIREKYR